MDRNKEDPKRPRKTGPNSYLVVLSSCFHVALAFMPAHILGMTDPKMSESVAESFDNHRDSLAAANTSGGQTVLQPFAAQFV